MSLFNSWIENKLEFENNLELIKILAEGARYVKSRDEYKDSDLYPTRPIVSGDLILTSATDFLKKKPNESLRVGDFNFLVVSPSEKTSDTIRVIGSGNLKGKEIPKEDLIDVTKAFMYDPHLNLHPNMRIWVHIKPGSKNQAKMIAKRHSQFSQNVPLNIKRDQEEQEEYQKHLNVLKSLGASAVQTGGLAKAMQRRENELKRQQLKFVAPTSQSPKPEPPFEDMIRKVNQPTSISQSSFEDKLAQLKTNPNKDIDDETFRKMIQSKIN